MKRQLVGLMAVTLLLAACGATLPDGQAGKSPNAPASLASTPVKRPSTSAPTTSPAPRGPVLTASQKNAVRAAESYLDFSGFSMRGLIDQLSSEYGDGFSETDAKAAVNSMDVDWKAQAVRSAKSYLEMQGMSCKGLIEQLSSSYGDKYTKSEATYGAEKAGAC
jgi:hypothetical protein